jgi:hypothetical protein
VYTRADINRSHLLFVYVKSNFMLCGYVHSLYIIYIIFDKFTNITSFWIKYRLSCQIIYIYIYIYIYRLCVHLSGWLCYFLV